MLCLHLPFDIHHLPQKLEFGGNNGIKFELTTFLLLSLKSKTDESIVVVSVVSSYLYITAHYITVCAWQQKNNKRTSRRCTVLSMGLFSVTKTETSG